DALLYPMNPTIEGRQKWTADFAQTLGKVERSIEGGDIDPLVLIEIARAVSWHAHHGAEETSAVARRILAFVPDGLEFRTLRALVDGHGLIIERDADFQKQQENWNEYLNALVDDMLRYYPDGEALRAFVERQLAHIKSSHAGASSSSYVLYSRLVAASPS